MVPNWIMIGFVCGGFNSPTLILQNEYLFTNNNRIVFRSLISKQNVIPTSRALVSIGKQTMYLQRHCLQVLHT